MIKLVSLKKSEEFKTVLKGKIHTDFFSLFAFKNLRAQKSIRKLNISFVMKKKSEIQ